MTASIYIPLIGFGLYLLLAMGIGFFTRKEQKEDLGKLPGEVDELELPKALEKLESDKEFRTLGCQIGCGAITFLVLLFCLSMPYFAAERSWIVYVISFAAGSAAIVIGRPSTLMLGGLALGLGYLIEGNIIPAIVAVILFGGSGLAWKFLRGSEPLHQEGNLWKAELYGHWGDGEELKKLLPKLRADTEIDRAQVTWLDANLAYIEGDLKKARRSLAGLRAKPKTDCLLLWIYQEEGNWEKFRERLEKHSPATASTILDQLPRTRELNEIRFDYMIRSNNWSEVEAILADLNEEEATKRLLEAPQNRERDNYLIPKLYSLGHREDLLNLLKYYGLDGGLARMETLIPEGPVRNQWAALFLHQNGDLKEIRQILGKRPTDRALAVALELPPGRTKDFVLVGLWAKSGDVDAVVDYFAGRPAEDAIKILTKFSSNPVRDRMLGRIYVDNGIYKKAVALLKPLMAEKKLKPAEIKALARCYGKLGAPKLELAALEKAWSLKISDQEALVEINTKSKALGRPSALLSKLGPKTFQKLTAKALWTLIQHYRTFDLGGLAKKAAAVSVEKWKESRAAMFLGGVLENERAYKKAADIYGLAGKKGGLSQAVCLVRAGRYAEALTGLEHVSPNDWNRPVVAYHQGYALYRQGRFEEAAEAWTAADPERTDPELRRDIALAFCQMAQQALEEQRFQDTAAHLEKGLAYTLSDGEDLASSMSRTLADTWYKLALTNILDPSARPGQARSFLEKARNVHPAPWPELDFLEGLMRLKDREVDQARAVFNRLVQTSPEDKALLFHQALAASAAEDVEFARQAFQTIVADGSDDAYANRARLLLGGMEIRAGNLEAAEQFLKTALGDG